MKRIQLISVTAIALLASASAHADEKGIVVVTDVRNVKVAGSSGEGNISVPFGSYSFSRASATPYSEFRRSISGTSTSEANAPSQTSVSQISKVTATGITYQSQLSLKNRADAANHQSFAQSEVGSSIQVVFTVDQQTAFSVGVGYSFQFCDSHGMPIPVEWTFSLTSSKEETLAKHTAKAAPWCHSKNGPQSGHPASMFWNIKGTFLPNVTYTLELTESKKSSESRGSHLDAQIDSSLVLNLLPKGLN